MPKACGHPAAAGVGGTQLVEDFAGELGGRQHRGQRLDRLRRLAVEDQTRDRPFPGALDIAGGHGVGRLVVVEHRTAAHFLPVVILGVDPEDRDGRNAVRRAHLAGELDGRDRLVQGVERPAEQPRLLSGDHRDRGRPIERGGGLERLSRRAALGQLPAEHRRQRRRRPRGGVHAADDLDPGLRLARIPGVERRQLIEREGVVGGQATHPRELTYVDREGARG